MKRKIFSLSLTLLLGLFTWNATAATGWYEDYIKISVNEGNVWGPSGYYWIETNPGWATNFVNGFGNVTSLKLDGADIKYWSDTQDRTSGSLFYEVKSADGLTTYTAFTEITTTQSYLGGNNYQGLSSGLNTDLLAGVPAGKACKLSIYAKSTGTGQGDSYLSNLSANYVATFTKASVAITGATGIADGTSYTTLKGAFDAINANASGVNTDKVSVKVYDNTTETATAVLSNKGINTYSSTAGSNYQAPVITLTGGTTSAAGSLTTTITNGVITSITMTGGTWTVKPTSITIAAPAGGGTTATATSAGTSGNQTFTITNGGTNYGPSATFSGGGGSGAAMDVKITTAATALSGAGPRTATPALVGLTYTLTSIGTGYTSAPTCAISAFTGATAGTVTGITVFPGVFGRVAVYPTVAGKTISGAVGLISILGCNNVAIDGRVNRTGSPSVGDADNLTISTTHATNPAILFNNNAQIDTVKYCTLKGQETSSPLGILNFGSVATVSNGNGLNVIDYNMFTTPNGLVSFTSPMYAIYAQGNSAFPNASNKITNNEFKNLIATYAASTTINILGGVSAPQNDNYTISGNSFYSAQADCFTADQKSREIIRIGASAAAFGGSHTISGNYIGGSAAGCSGTLTKTSIAAPFLGMILYPSPSVTSGGAAITRIQGNTIKNINWNNGYFPAAWTGISIAGGTGAVSIGTTTPNSIGDNTTNNSITLSNTGASNVSATMIQIATSGSVDCQYNKIGSITATNTTPNYYVNVNGINKTATAGTTTISNNVIGSTTQANSISTTSSCPATLVANLSQSILAIACSGTGTNTINTNTIANVTSNASGTITTPGAFTTAASAYGIQCNAGSGTNTVSGNTISNITNNVASIITGNIFAITMSGTTGTINNNLIHSNTVIGATTGTVYGIWCATGANTVSNNIVKLGDDNPYEIRAVGDASGANDTKIFHNTIFLSGTPTSLALSSAALFSSGQTTRRSYKNNICYNARTNGTGCTSVHYGFNANSVSGAGVIYSDGNCYWAPGVGGKIGRFSSDKTTMPVVTGHDSASVNVAPSFVNIGGTSASDYMLTSATSMAGISTGTGVVLDFNSASRVVPTIGAFETIAPILTTSVSTLTNLNYATGAGPSGYLNSFDVSGGSTISGNITITAPTNFEVSKTGVTSEYTPSVTVAAISGSVAATPIYVRLVGGLSANTYTGDITVSATNALSKTVACTGIVDVTVAVKTAISDELRIVNSKGQVNITGAKAGQLIQVYNASGLLISSTIATSGDNRVSLSNGLLIIKVGTAVRKVLVK